MHQILIHQLGFSRLREETSSNFCWSVSFSLWLVRGFTLTLVYEGQGKPTSVDHLTVLWPFVCLVPWPFNRSLAGSCPVMLQTSCSSFANRVTVYFHADAPVNIKHLWLVPRETNLTVSRGTSLQVIYYIAANFETGKSLNLTVTAVVTIWSHIFCNFAR